MRFCTSSDQHGKSLSKALASEERLLGVSNADTYASHVSDLELREVAFVSKVQSGRPAF